MAEKTATKKAEEPTAAEKAEAKAATERQRKIDRGECVVDDGTPHVGRAVNGLVCSAHAMHYLADGTPRAR